MNLDKNTFKLRARLLCLILSITSFLAQVSFASPDIQTDLEQVNQTFTFNLDGQISADTYFEEVPATESTYYLGESFVTLSTAYQERIRLALSANLAELINMSDTSFTEDIDWEKFVREAYIEIRNINDMPVAIIIGKQPIFFGQNIQQMPSWAQGPMRPVQEIREVFGITVSLTDTLLGLFDQIDYSLFEQGSGDLSIGKLNGQNIRFTKYLNKNLLLTMGAKRIRVSDIESENQHQARIGLVGKSNNGKLIGWAEGVFLSNDPAYPGSNFAMTVGASYELLPNSTVVVELNYVNKYLTQLGFGLKTQMNETLQAGIDIRMGQNLQTNEMEYFLGFNLTYYFGMGSNRNQNDELHIFDDEHFDIFDEELPEVGQ